MQIKPNNISPNAESGRIVDAVDHIVIADLPCRRCGYNLRTLAEEGHCPECGAPVQHSTRDHILHLAAPDWIRRVSWGLQMILIAAIANCFLYPSVGCFSTISVGLWQAMVVVVAAVDCRGAWWLTEREATLAEDRRLDAARKEVRIATAIVLLCMILLLVFRFLSGALRSNFESLAITVALISQIANLGNWLARLRTFALLARRIPGERISRQLNTIRIGLLIYVTLLVIGMVGAFVSAFGGMRGIQVLLVFVVLPGAVGLIIFVIWTIVCIHRLYVAVDREWATALALLDDEAIENSEVAPTIRAT
ncbi:MAG: hypothetical protein H6818_00370 [Phycisphaerales bacterium]|nr:hypothetical protein [Phycisphaerales bacterium]